MSIHLILQIFYTDSSESFQRIDKNVIDYEAFSENNDEMPFKDIEKKRAYQREYKRKWYQENKSKHIGYVRKRDIGIDTWFRAYKETLSCEVCGENHPACLDFHHIDPSQKKFSVSTRRDRPSLKKLQEEIAKCRVLCANCHRKEHYKQKEKERNRS